METLVSVLIVALIVATVFSAFGWRSAAYWKQCHANDTERQQDRLRDAHDGWRKCSQELESVRKSLAVAALEAATLHKNISDSILKSGK